jgi:hypothetical protein
MNEKELKKIYYLSIMPRIILGTLNSLVSFGLAIFLLVIGIERCTSGVYSSKMTLPIAPFALNERQESADKEADKKIWQESFDKYARKITINNSETIYKFELVIRSLPLNRPSHVELAFEIYNNDKDYLFTFYADDYWNQDGYDEGHWHEWNYKEELTLQFPKNGDFYILAGVPAGKDNSIFFETLLKYADGRVSASIFSGVKPLSPVPLVFGIILLLVASVLLFIFRTGDVANYKIVWGNLFFESKDYLVKIKGEKGSGLYFVRGYIKNIAMRGEWSDTIELILLRDGSECYLEIEKEIESSGDSATTKYYYYLYDLVKGDIFKKLPRGATIEFQGKNFKLETEKGLREYNFVYHHGKKETLKRVDFDYGYHDEEFLSFEYPEKDEDEFDVSYGKKIKKAMVWEVTKR